QALISWDHAVETTEQLIAAKERCHAWLLNRLINHHAARRHWNTVTLGEVILERSERSARHNEYPVLTSSRRGLFLQSEYFSKQITSEDNTGYKIMRRGDFTFRSMSDDGRFAFNRLEKHEAGIISPAYGVFHTNGVNPEFLAHLLNSTYFYQLLARETQGGTRKALRFSALDGMEIDLPPRAGQESIAALLDESLVEIDLLGQTVGALKTQKRGMMQKLLTGQWRLNGGFDE
ncbi:MAG: restriction endonuclease subunit S, partial [Burkholderiales bacterium]